MVTDGNISHVLLVFQNTSNPEFLWRYAKAVHQKNLASSDIHMKKDYAYRAKDLAFAALACDGGDGIADVHKW